MPKVFKVKGRKDYPEFGIKKGDEHYTWSVMTGPRSSRTYRSLTPPKPSQLTGSPFLQEYYSIQEQIENLTAESAEDLKSQIEEIIGNIENLRDETQGNLDNMPEGLQQGDTGQLLQERVDGLDGWISDLEGVDLDFEFDEEEPEEPEKEKEETDEEFEERQTEYETEKEEWETRGEEAKVELVQAQIEEVQGFDAGL